MAASLKIIYYSLILVLIRSQVTLPESPLGRQHQRSHGAQLMNLAHIHRRQHTRSAITGHIANCQKQQTSTNRLQAALPLT